MTHLKENTEIQKLEEEKKTDRPIPEKVVEDKKTIFFCLIWPVKCKCVTSNYLAALIVVIIWYISQFTGSTEKNA